MASIQKRRRKDGGVSWDMECASVASLPAENPSARSMRPTPGTLAPRRPPTVARWFWALT